jgi:hypothetical protein
LSTAPKPSRATIAAVDGELERLVSGDLADLSHAAFVIGKLVGDDRFPRLWAESRLRKAAGKASYSDNYEAGIVSGAISDGLEAGQKQHKPEAANDNYRDADDDTIDAETLLGMTFPPIKYVIDGYLVEGLTVLAGKPKLGKSWWAYDAAIAVATGGRAMGSVECEQGDVLYLALEDNRRRVQNRIRTVCPLSKRLGINVARLKVRTRAPRVDTGLLVAVEKWRASVAKARLVLIDVWLKVRPPRKNGADPYAADYAAAEPLQRYANEHGLAVVIVTHTRKMLAEDPLESVSGTNGITGVADTVLVLSRGANGMTLYGRGRDIEEIDTAMKFDGGRWTILGDATEVNRSNERRRIIEALALAGKPIGPKELAELSGLKYENVRRMLIRMATAGEISKAGRGAYACLNGPNGPNGAAGPNVSSKPASNTAEAA